MSETKIKLGHYVKDVVSQIEGTVIAHTTWLTGCDTVQVEPKPTSTGERQSAITFDITRIKYVNDGVREEFFPEEFKKEQPKSTKKPGGPHDSMQPARTL